MLDRLWLQHYNLSEVSVNGQTRIFTISSDKSSLIHKGQETLSQSLTKVSQHCLTAAFDQGHCEGACLSAESESCRQTAPPVQKPHSGCAHAKALPRSTCSRPNAGAVLSRSVQPVPCPSSCGETGDCSAGSRPQGASGLPFAALVLFPTELWE